MFHFSQWSEWISGERFLVSLKSEVLTFISSAWRRKREAEWKTKGKKVSLNNKHSNFISMWAGCNQKFFPFAVPVTFSTPRTYSFHFYGKWPSEHLNFFLPVVNSWAQVRDSASQKMQLLSTVMISHLCLNNPQYGGYYNSEQPDFVIAWPAMN
jgi:hypothetical protein